MNYMVANEKLGSRTRRKLCNNTYLERRGNDIAVKLHLTDVLTFRPDGSTVYNSGRWRTATTQNRMNEFGPAGMYIWRDKGIWSLGRTQGSRKLYEDGIIVTKHGRIIGGGSLAKSKAAIFLNKQVNTYCKAFAVALAEGKIEKPGPGDCWCCSMIATAPEKDKGKSLGDATGNCDHILSHIKEKYYVPSLLLNADKEPGAPISVVVRSLIAEIWNGKPLVGSWRGIVISQVTKTLRKYIKHKLGMVV
jgi:hypothetical protein